MPLTAPTLARLIALVEGGTLNRNTAVKVSRVGQMVGYSNVSYFCAAFQKRFGKTPSEWRAGQCGEDTYLRP